MYKINNKQKSTCKTKTNKKIINIQKKIKNKTTKKQVIINIMQIK